MNQEPNTTSEPFDEDIVRRLGNVPSHKECTCPHSWSSAVTIVEPNSQDQSPLFAFAIDQSTVAKPEQRADITEQVQRFDGSGGLAPYEDFAVINENRAVLMRSIAAACFEIGVQLHPDGSSQEPLPGMAGLNPNALPLRWSMDIAQSLLD